jgi:protein phosphatase 1 regulatory subunit 10
VILKRRNHVSNYNVSVPTWTAIRDMASNIASKWRALLPSGLTPASTKAGEGESRQFDSLVGCSLTCWTDADVKNKKRKAEELPPATRGVPLAKKGSATTVVASSSKVASTSTKKPVAKPSVVKDAKTDSSFFSASKPKPKLPDFKKAAAPVKKEPDPNVAQPSSYNPFEELVKSMKPRKESPATATPPPTVPVAGSSTTDVKKLSKKKSVSWAPDGQLELVKIIERAVYEDDPADVSSLLFRIFYVLYINHTYARHAPIDTQGLHGAHSVRELDRSEGAALIAHLFEEQVDWSEPIRKQTNPHDEGIRFDNLFADFQL